MGNWQGADRMGKGADGVVADVNGSIYDDELCSEDGESDCQSFKAGFTFFFQAFFGIIAGAKILGDLMYANNSLNESPKVFACCGNGCGPCCPKSGGSDESIEMTETAGGEESRDAITGI